MRVVILAAIVLLGGCVQVGPKTVPVAECPKLTVPAEPKCPALTVPKCPSWNMPGIPLVVNIKIDGNKVWADQGGEQMIRDYAQAQRLLRQ